MRRFRCSYNRGNMKKSDVGGLSLRPRGGAYKSCLTGFATFFVAFLVSGLAAGSLMPAMETDAQEVSVAVKGGYRVEVGSGGTVGPIELNPTPEGTLAKDSDSLHIFSNVPGGYRIYLHATSGSSDIREENDTSSANTTYFTTGGGTKDAPAALAANKWGYAMTDSTSFVQVASAQVNGLAYVSANKSAQVGDDYTFYYGFNANTDMPTGTYATEVTYTVIADVPDYTVSSVSPTAFSLNDTNQTITIVTTDPGNEIGLGDTITATLGGVALTGCTQVLVGNYAGATCTYPGGLPVGTYDLVLTTENQGVFPTKTGAVTITSPYTLTSVSPTSWYAGNAQSLTIVTDAPSSGIGLGTVTGTIGSTALTNCSATTSGSYLAATCTAPASVTSGTYAISITSAGHNTTYTKASAVTVNVSSITTGTYMQDITQAMCNNTTEGTRVQVKDSRDQQNYYVTRLKDGHCWMTSNLKFANGTVNGVQIPAAASSGSSNNTTPQVWANSGQDGYLYNWCAAVTISNCSSTTSEPTTSICPAGWRLPTNSGDYSFSNLFSKYSLPSSNTSGNYVSTVEAAPLYFTRAGYYVSGYGLQGSRGYYWSRTPYGASRAYDFLYDTSYFYPQNDDYKLNGFSVRCMMADPDTRTLSDLTNMQDMTTKICANSAENESKSLADNRDTNSYRVTKLKDGNCWMTQNLKLAGPKTLTPADSNVSANVDIPAAASSGTSNATSMQIWNQYSGYDGNYYNWCAATVSGDCSAITTEQINSVCPKGFRLPGNSDYHSFSYLFGKYSLPTTNTTGNHVGTTEATPLLFTRAGYYNSNYLVQGTSGFYPSRIPTDSANTCIIFLYSTNGFSPKNTNYKERGFSIRCLSN